jgi:hypothetical protein
MPKAWSNPPPLHQSKLKRRQAVSVCDGFSSRVLPGEDENRTEVRLKPQGGFERRTGRDGPEGGMPKAWSNPFPSASLI